MDIEEKESTVQNEDELKDENETATIEQPSAEEGAEEEVKNEEAEESPAKGMDHTGESELLRYHSCF